MGIEIERKFLIRNSEWKENIESSYKITQGFLSLAKERTVRVRIIDDKAVFTIKGENNNLTRSEFEYNIPLEDGLQLIKLCEKPIIEKTRSIVIENGNKWEVDVFEGENKGLIIAEIELETEDQEIEIPNWIGEDVSTESKYYNSSLIKNPYCNWK